MHCAKYGCPILVQVQNAKIRFANTRGVFQHGLEQRPQGFRATS